MVDDEQDLLCALTDILQDSGFAVVAAVEGEDAVEIASLYQPDVLITDFSLPGIDGVDTLSQIKERWPSMRALLVSGHISEKTRVRAENEHVDRIMQKPVSIPELLRAVRAARHRVAN